MYISVETDAVMVNPLSNLDEIHASAQETLSLANAELAKILNANPNMDTGINNKANFATMNSQQLSQMIANMDATGKSKEFQDLYKHLTNAHLIRQKEEEVAQAYNGIKSTLGKGDNLSNMNLNYTKGVLGDLGNFKHLYSNSEFFKSMMNSNGISSVEQWDALTPKAKNLIISHSLIDKGIIDLKDFSIKKGTYFGSIEYKMAKKLIDGISSETKDNIISQASKINPNPEEIKFPVVSSENIPFYKPQIIGGKMQYVLDMDKMNIFSKAITNHMKNKSMEMEFFDLKDGNMVKVETPVGSDGKLGYRPESFMIENNPRTGGHIYGYVVGDDNKKYYFNTDNIAIRDEMGNAFKLGGYIKSSPEYKVNELFKMMAVNQLVTYKKTIGTGSGMINLTVKNIEPAKTLKQIGTKSDTFYNSNNVEITLEGLGSVEKYRGAEAIEKLQEISSQIELPQISY